MGWMYQCVALSTLLFSGMSSRTDRQFYPTPDKSAKYGYYVPKNLHEALHELDKGFDDSEKKRIRAMKSQDDMIDYHDGLGMWIRNNWLLWAHGPLWEYLAKLGLRHPDEMSVLILEQYWRKLNGLTLDTTVNLAKVNERWEAYKMPDLHFCSWDNTPLNVNVGLDGREVVEGFPGTAWFGRCKNGHLWAYHHVSGWFRPEGKLLDDFHKMESRRAPKKT